MSSTCTTSLSEQEQQKILEKVRISELYYQESLTQAEIARELGMSRLKVNRLLQEARQDGIVRIEVVNPLSTCSDLEHRLQDEFNLKGAVVLPVAEDSAPAIAREIGRAGARLLTGLVRDGDLVGVGWGTTVYELVQALEGQRKVRTTVVPLIGGLGEVHAHFQINDFARQAAEKLGGTWKALHAPFLVERKEIKDALLSDTLIRDTVGLWNDLDYAVVGIGVSISKSPMLSIQYFTNAHLIELQRQGIVGDICSRFFDREGKLCSWDINDRLIGITLEQLDTVANVIAVAGGTIKREAILAALRRGTVDYIVIDEQTAKALVGSEESSLTG